MITFWKVYKIDGQKLEKHFFGLFFVITSGISCTIKGPISTIENNAGLLVVLFNLTGFNVPLPQKRYLNKCYIQLDLWTILGTEFMV